jgi:DNA-binding SARP family transcriptional activator/tetratricopeptide (TPR) repeat protein
MVRYAILGPVELCEGELRTPIGGRRQAALLAVLLLNANRALSSDSLIDVLWGDRGPVAAKRLQAAILRLRRTLDPEGTRDESVLRTVAGGYLLAVSPGELDADVFQARLRDGCRALEGGDARSARDALSEALRMWRGPALAEVAYEEFAQPEIRRLEELRLAALETRIEAELRLGEDSGLIGELEVLVAAHPGRERLAGQLMLALYRCGRQGEALDVYARTRAYLSSELGLEPGPALRTLQDGILSQSPVLQLGCDAPGTDSAARHSADEQAVASTPVLLALPRSLRIPPDSPFVGRHKELERLREHWNEVHGGARAAIMIGGEAGIGKTRLAAELAHRVREQGALVLYGRCDEGLAVPYQPFVEALRPYAGMVGPERLHALLGELAPELGRLLRELAGLGDPVRGDPESERFALFEAVAALLEAATRDRSAVLILDDLHWAARPTLLLLRHLIRTERRISVLVLATYRTTEMDPGDSLGQVLADLHRDASTDHLVIEGLDEPAIAALLQATAAHSATTDAAQVVHELQAQTGGNPFFIRELLANLAGSGTGSGLGMTVAPLPAPEEVRHVISHRVARLSPSAGRVLRVAAVAGATFSFVVLERAMGGRSAVLDGLDEAVAAGLLVELGRDDYAFAHALVRHTIYEQLGAARRIDLHRRLGEALETLGDTDNHLEALAYHFAQAAPDGQHVRAAHYALAAGRHAVARLGFEESAAHYERGLAALAQTGRRHAARRCELLLGLGEARWGAGELDNARQAYHEAAELAEELGDATALARAALGACGPHRFETAASVTDNDPNAGLLQRALAVLDEDDGTLRARLMGRLACALAHTGAPSQPTLAGGALAMARRVGDKATLADVLASKLWVIHGPDALHESVDLAQELVRVADEIESSELLALAHWWLLEYLLELGDIEAVECEKEALQRLVGPRRERYFSWLLGVLAANHAQFEGRMEDGERLAHDAFAHRLDGNDEIAVHVFGAQMLFLRNEQGRLGELVQGIEEFTRLYPEITGYRCVLAYIYAQLGRTEDARREFEAVAQDDFRGLPRSVYWLASMSVLCEVAAFLGDGPRARALYELLLPFADRYVVVFGFLCRGSVSRLLGLLATTLRRLDDATRHFEYALAMNARIGAALSNAHTQHDYARMLLQRDCPGDRDTALHYLRPALVTAAQLELTALADKAGPLMAAAEASRPVSATSTRRAA